jgi:acyl-CoA synthetase (AMP-forming)/AMP-acid ligase II
MASDELREQKKAGAKIQEKHMIELLLAYHGRCVLHFDDFQSTRYIGYKIMGVDHVIISGHRAVLVQDKNRERKNMSYKDIDALNAVKERYAAPLLELYGVTEVTAILASTARMDTKHMLEVRASSPVIVMDGVEDVKELMTTVYLKVCEVLKLTRLAASHGDIEMEDAA